MPDLVQEIQDRIQSQGGRMTAQRRMIVETLQCLESHPTAEELHALVSRRDPNIHLSTVYRTLRWLESEGLVKARIFGEARQERFDPAMPVEHYHFICKSCNTIIEFDSQLVNTLMAQFEQRSGACVESGTVVLHGICAECLAREKEAA